MTGLSHFGCLLIWPTVQRRVPEWASSAITVRHLRFLSLPSLADSRNDLAFALSAGRPADADAAVRGGSHLVADSSSSAIRWGKAIKWQQNGACGLPARKLPSIRLAPGLRATFTGDKHALLCMKKRCPGGCDRMARRVLAGAHGNLFDVSDLRHRIQDGPGQALVGLSDGLGQLTTESIT